VAEREHQTLLLDAISREAEAHRLLLAGDAGGARGRFREAADLYRRSWEAAPERAFGRLVGMLKAAVLAGDPQEAGAYVRATLGSQADSASSWYAVALAAIVQDDDELARRAARGMREAAGELGAGAGAFTRTADAIEALADSDRERYASAVGRIVADFEARDEHLTGVPIADTALMLERLAARRGIAAEPDSALLPRW
jgi:predicted Zn-dependent protease